MGYTVVDTTTVIATHLSNELLSHSHELLGREEVQQLLDNLAKTNPKLVEGLVPDTLPLGVVHKVLRNLLEEKIPLKDMRTIAESLASEASMSQDPVVLTGLLRIALGRLIIQSINGIEKELPVITLDQTLEQLLQDSMHPEGNGGLGVEPGLAEKIHLSLAEAAQKQELANQPAVLLVSSALRPMMSRFVKYSIPVLHVLSYEEMPDNKQIKIVASVGRNEP